MPPVQQRDLLALLSHVAGKKTLLLDKSISALISSLASFSLLQEHGIESIQWLDAVEAGSKVIIVCRPMRECATEVCRIASMPGKQVSVIVVPRRTLQFDEAIQSVSSSIDVHCLPMHYYQAEQDLIMVDGDSVFDMAVTLIQLQQEYGILHRLLGKGSAAQQLASLLTQLKADVVIEQKQELEPGTFGDCIIMDRSVDQLTPFLTQLTYEGLLRETIATDLQGKTSDDIFRELRGLNFSQVGPRLSSKAATLAAGFDERHGAKTTSALKAFVSKIPDLQGLQKQLKMHVGQAETLMQRTRSTEFRRILELEQSIYVGEQESLVAQDMEVLIARQVPLSAVLRLLCCWSLVHNGIKQTQYDHFVHLVAQAYGHRTILTVHALAQRGLLVVRSPTTEKSRGSWMSFSRSWKLLTADDDADLSHLYSGYVPLSLRILQGLNNPSSLDGFDVLYKSLRGPQVNVAQSSSRAHKEDILVVAFLGGCTATELAGVRYIAEKSGREILILTSKVITGNDLVVS